MTDHEELAKRARTASSPEFALVPWEQCEPETRAAWLAVARALVPEGWAVVPVEPTPEMMRAADVARDKSAINNYGGEPSAEGYWMFWVAPSP